MVQDRHPKRTRGLAFGQHDLALAAHALVHQHAFDLHAPQSGLHRLAVDSQFSRQVAHARHFLRPMPPLHFRAQISSYLPSRGNKMNGLHTTIVHSEGSELREKKMWILRRDCHQVGKTIPQKGLGPKAEFFCARAGRGVFVSRHCMRAALPPRPKPPRQQPCLNPIREYPKTHSAPYPRRARSLQLS